MQISFKNILVGLGTATIFFVAVYVGLKSSANYIFEEDKQVLPTSKNTNSSDSLVLKNALPKDHKACFSKEEYKEDMDFKNTESLLYTFSSSPDSNLAGQTKDAEGNIYKWDFQAKFAKIAVYNKQNVFLKNIYLNQDSPIKNMVVDESGNLYLVFEGSDHISKYSPKWICGIITIKKVTIENSQSLKQSTENFDFGKNFSQNQNGANILRPFYSNFSLSDGSSDSIPTQVSFYMLHRGEYKVFENSSIGYKKRVNCIDPTNNSKIEQNSLTAIINLDKKPNSEEIEEVVCTFENVEIQNN